MSDRSSIEWTDATWNPVRGCTKTSPGCKNCYAERFAERFRVHDLTTVPAHVRFLSVEPLLGPIEALPLGGIHWVVVGGESGPRCRPMDPAWVQSIRRQGAAHGVPFFFKQWGGTQKKRAGRLLDGREWNEMPLLAEGGGDSDPSASFATR
jgi:protein gp37